MEWRENAFLQHVRAARGVQEKMKGEKKDTEEDAGRRRGGEGAKLIRGRESSGREKRKREDERASSISPTW